MGPIKSSILALCRTVASSITRQALPKIVKQTNELFTGACTASTAPKIEVQSKNLFTKSYTAAIEREWKLAGQVGEKTFRKE